MSSLTDLFFGLAFLAVFTALIVGVAVVLGRREDQMSTPEVEEWVRQRVKRAS